jgi:peptide/nickel transport system substrate-binding protein
MSWSRTATSPSGRTRKRPVRWCRPNVNRNVMMNREAAPFDKPELRRAVALTLDRKAFVDTLTEGKGDFGGAMLPPPEGVWGMPAEMLKSLPSRAPTR